MPEQPRKPARSRAKRAPTAPPKPQRAAVPSRSSAPRRRPGQVRQSPPIPPELVQYFGGPEMVELIVAEQVPDDARPGDVLRFLLEARRLQADPLRGDLFLKRDTARDGGEPAYVVVAKRDALLAHARRQPAFRSHDEAAIYSDDSFERGKPIADGRTLADRAGISHTSFAPGQRGRLVGAWCAVEMAGEPPIVRVLDADQYVGTQEERAQLDPESPQRRYPDACMIAAAMSNVLRIACGLNDVVGAEELTQRAPAPPDLARPTTAAIFPSGPVDATDARILDAHREAQRLDPLMWPAAKVRAQLAGCGEDEESRGALADTIESEVRAEVVGRLDPAAIDARLAELRAFDSSTLDADDLTAYRSEVTALEAAQRLLVA